MQEVQGRSSLVDEIVLIYFSYFPSEFAVGPALSVRAMAAHLARHIRVRIVTLNYDQAKGSRLFPEPHHVRQENGCTVEYLPYDLRRLGALFRIMRAANTAVGLNCGFDYRLAIPALFIHKLFGRAKRIVHFPHGIFLPGVFGQKHRKKWLFCRVFDTLRLGRNLLHVASSEQEQSSIRNALASPQDIIVLPHFAQVPAPLAAAEPKRPQELRMYFAGRVAREKNLIGAIDILTRVQVPCEFDIIGPIVDEDYYRLCI